MKRNLFLATVLAAVLVTSVANATYPTVETTGFPDANATSGKFINLTRGLSSLGDTATHLQLEVPSHLSTFQFKIFDGDMGGKWDNTAPVSATPDQVWYELYADPFLSRSTAPADFITRWSSSDLPDDNWFETSLANDPRAANSARGTYTYCLRVIWQGNTLANQQNNFKVAIEGQVFGLRGGNYGFIGYTPADPSPKFQPSTYDGAWEFDLDVDELPSLIEFWNGDFDRADDTDSATTPAFPPFAYSPSTLAEGARAGNPADDAPTGSPLRMSPAIYFVVTPPDGSWQVTNDNPSGNQEWETFRVGLFASDGLDAQQPRLPRGRYDWRIFGADGRNTLFLHPTYNLYAGGLPGAIGDVVWHDANHNGVQDDGPSAGIPGVSVSLWQDTDNNGSFETEIGTTTTDSGGSYLFSDLFPGSYEVRIDTATLPAYMIQTYDYDNGTGPFVTPNASRVVLGVAEANTDVDFGYTGAGSIGDLVWFDANGNGAQDSGELGIPGVTVKLLDASNNVIATTTTDSSGLYSFTDQPADVYTVAIDTSTLPAGLTATYDLDGLGTPSVATVTLAAGATRTDLDFGYTGTGSIGDTLWLDANGNGMQDSGETGLSGVTVRLLNADGTVIASTTTSATGTYTFANLAAGTYSVVVETSTLPAGLVATYDLDGLGTPSVATVTLVAGANRTDLDFGYKPAGAFQGCSPGYWKQAQHFDSWVTYKTTDMYNSVFGVNYAKTLLNALGTGGGGAKALGRQAVAAILNVTNPNVNYRYSIPTIISMVQNAHLTGNYDTAKNAFEAENSNTTCPLN